MNDISFYCIQIGMFLLGYASCWLVDAILKGTDMQSSHIEDDMPNLFKGDSNPEDIDGKLNPHEFEYDLD